MMRSRSFEKIPFVFYIMGSHDFPAGPAGWYTAFGRSSVSALLGHKRI